MILRIIAPVIRFFNAKGNASRATLLCRNQAQRSHNNILPQLFRKLPVPLTGSGRLRPRHEADPASIRLLFGWPKRREIMNRNSAILTMVVPLLLAAGCSDDPQQPEASADRPVAISAVDSPPAFLPKDMAWMPKDIWLPEDFEPTQSLKMNPMAETYLLRGNTQASAADLLAAYNQRMIASGYEPFAVGKPKPGIIAFRGNGHGAIVIRVLDEGAKRVLAISVENATGS